MDPGLVLVHRVQDGLQDNVVNDIDYHHDGDEGASSLKLLACGLVVEL